MKFTDSNRKFHVRLVERPSIISDCFRTPIVLIKTISQDSTNLLWEKEHTMPLLSAIDNFGDSECVFRKFDKAVHQKIYFRDLKIHRSRLEILMTLVLILDPLFCMAKLR